MRKLFGSMFLVLALALAAHGAQDKYRITVSTKTDQPGYQISGQVKFKLGPSTSTTTVEISSSAVMLPNASGSITGAGTGSGLDADKLDGQHGSYFLPVSTITEATQAAPVTTWVSSAAYAASATTAGACTGNAATATNADQLDGQHGSYYLPVSTITGASQASPVSTWVTSATYAVNGGSGGSGSGDSIKKYYTQASHGFVKGKAVYYNGTAWLQAQANSVATAGALGIVDDVGSSSFSIVMQGYISSGNGVAWTPGAVYYLSDTSSGTLTTTEPTTYGYVSKPMLFALGTSSGIVVNMRGVCVTQAGVYDGVPVGGVILYSTTTAPSDFLYCNGSAVSRTIYSALFASIGTRYGTGDGSTTFNVPDMRGLFTRGVDDGKGFDDETGRVVGSTETDKYQGHFHRAYFRDYGYGGTGSNNQLDAMQQDSPMVTTGGDATSGARARESISNGTNGTPRTGNETRPKNMAWAYMIKYRVNISTQGGILDQANTWTKPQTYSTSVFFSNGSEQTVAYKQMSSSAVVITAGNYSTSSGSYGDVDAARAILTITTLSTSKVFVSVKAAGHGATAGGTYYLAVIMDGNYVDSVQSDCSANNYDTNLSFTTMVPTVTAGSHIFKLQIKESGGALTLLANAACPLSFSVQEIR